MSHWGLGCLLECERWIDALDPWDVMAKPCRVTHPHTMLGIGMCCKQHGEFGCNTQCLQIF